jgi:pimeloyl-ACP methyl ester carboxylesterase
MMAIIIIILSVYSGSIIVVPLSLSSSSSFSAVMTPAAAYAQTNLQTIKTRNLIIDLGNGIKTKAQITYPALGKGPFPAVLLVHGSGPVDMNETLGYIHIDKKTGEKIYPQSQPFFQISQYLSQRGFAVLRYDKRGIGENHTILNSNVWGNVTFNNLKQDAEKALAVLIKQPEVDPTSKITIIGHSEGTMITPRVAIDNETTKVKNLVLMGAVAHNLRDLLYYQAVSIPLLYAENVLDHNHDGLLSVSEASKNPTFNNIVENFTLVLETNNNTAANGTKYHQLNPQYNTNKDAYISINNELKPKLEARFKSFSVITPGKKCTGTCPIWLKSHYALEPTLSIIGNVPPTTSILILNGENDSQTPIQQAFLLQQELIDKRHPDHTLITYPNLGHAFYPSSEWHTALGPIQPYVLADLYSWLESHSGFTSPSSPTIRISSTNNTTMPSPPHSSSSTNSTLHR